LHARTNKGGDLIEPDGDNLGELTPVPVLLAQARGGDGRALERLFQRCRNFLALAARAQVESWLRAKVDASDLVQQTMLEAYRGFERFQGGSEAEWLAWLRQILAHNAADFVRRYGQADKRQARREVPLAAPPDASFGDSYLHPADPGESPSLALQRRERELIVADAISRLAPDYQEVIALRNLQRLPFDEVAQRMGRSRPAVQMLWLRALEKLQELLTGMTSWQLSTDGTPPDGKR
jgi:RNA polymerase sigma-70 factor (ECF subfamily)